MYSKSEKKKKKVIDISVVFTRQRMEYYFPGVLHIKDWEAQRE